MQFRSTDAPASEPEIWSEPIEKMKHGEEEYDQHTRGDRRAFEVTHLAGFICEVGGRRIETGETADAARHEIKQDRDVQAASQPGREADRSRRKTERNHIRERIEI